MFTRCRQQPRSMVRPTQDVRSASDIHQLQCAISIHLTKASTRPNNLILPDGQITDRSEIPVQPSREKYFASPNTQIKLIVSLSHPARGAYRDRHGRWDGMRWTRQCRARNCESQGDVIV